MIEPRPGDQARATVLVAVPPEVAFRVFTEEIDQWWRRGPKYRVAGENRGFIHLEPRVGGRLFESLRRRDRPGSSRPGPCASGSRRHGWCSSGAA